MTTETLKYIKNCMDQLNIPYSFNLWNSEVVFPYWVGEYTEIENMNEDGMSQYTFTLTGMSNESMLSLLGTVQKLKNYFQYVRSEIIPNGYGVAVSYINSLVIPTGEQGLFRVQVNLNVKEWGVDNE